MKGNLQFFKAWWVYRRFIKDFLKVPHPFCKLVEKEVEFVLDEACLKAFECLKERLISTLTIVVPDWSLPFEVMCNANGVALGEVLDKKQNKILHPIYYAGKALTTQKKYTVTEYELLL